MFIWIAPIHYTLSICHDALCSYLLNKCRAAVQTITHHHESILLPGSRLEQNGIWNVLAKNVSTVKVFFAETFQISFRSPASNQSLRGVCGVWWHRWVTSGTRVHQTLAGFFLDGGRRQPTVSHCSVSLCCSCLAVFPGGFWCVMFWITKFWVVCPAVLFTCAFFLSQPGMKWDCGNFPSPITESHTSHILIPPLLSPYRSHNCSRRNWTKPFSCFAAFVLHSQVQLRE